MKEILVITNYFPPETGAASNRIFHLVEGLNIRDYNVSVITPLPNYPRGEIFPDYRKSIYKISDENGISVHRLWIYASNSTNKIKRLLSMLSYSLSLIWFFVFNKIPKTVIIQSPPLIVAFTSIFFLRSKKRKIVLNVSDLWPLAGLELKALKRNLSYSLLEKIERFNYRKAGLVLGQSHEILEHISSVDKDKKLVLYRNFPNFKSNDPVHYRSPQIKIKLVYAGLLGVAQGIFKLCLNLDYSRIEFHIYGAGVDQKAIELYIKNNPNSPIQYHGEISRKELHKVLPQYDIAIIPLLNRIYGSVPSKIFEFSKLGLPILYFGGGEGETIMNDNNLGWSAQPGNYDNLNDVISKIDLDSLNSEYRNQIIKTADYNFDFNKQLDALKVLF